MLTMRHREIIVVARNSVESLEVLVGTPDVFEGFESVWCLKLEKVTDRQEYCWVMEGEGKHA